MDNTSIREVKPIWPLSGYVQCFWEGRFNNHALTDLSQLMVPNGFMELIIHISEEHCNLLHNGLTWGSSPDYTLLGMFTEPYSVKFDSPVRAFGVRLKPEGFYHLFGVPPSLLMDSFESIDTVVGNSITELCNALKEAKDINEHVHITEEYLLKRLNSHSFDSDVVANTLQMIRNSNGMLQLEEIERHISVGKRQLQRRFKEYVGISPKTYLRIARMNAVHNYMNQGGYQNLTGVAYENGYADQSHFIREFKEMNGINPSRFFRARDKFIVNPVQ